MATAIAAYYLKLTLPTVVSPARTRTPAARTRAHARSHHTPPLSHFYGSDRRGYGEENLYTFYSHFFLRLWLTAYIFLHFSNKIYNAWRTITLIYSHIYPLSIFIIFILFILYFMLYFCVPPFSMFLHFLALSLPAHHNYACIFRLICIYHYIFFLFLEKLILLSVLLLFIFRPLFFASFLHFSHHDIWYLSSLYIITLYHIAFVFLSLFLRHLISPRYFFFL